MEEQVVPLLSTNHRLPNWLIFTWHFPMVVQMGCQTTKERAESALWLFFFFVWKEVKSTKWMFVILIFYEQTCRSSLEVSATSQLHLLLPLLVIKHRQLGVGVSPVHLPEGHFNQNWIFKQTAIPELVEQRQFHQVEVDVCCGQVLLHKENLKMFQLSEDSPIFFFFDKMSPVASSWICSGCLA